MRILIQRVVEGSVRVEKEVVGSIDKGYVLLVAATDEDDTEIVEKMARKVANMRLFRDPEGSSHFHLSLKDVGGAALVVSQFTLFADTRKGRRPSFISAADPGHADQLIEYFSKCLRNMGIDVETGRFGADMQVALVNDGPVTIWLDSDELKRK